MLTKKEKFQRRQVLKDALAVINKPNIEVCQHNAYVQISCRESGFQEKVEEFTHQDKPFHTDLLKKSKATTCEVCALGAMFLGHVDRHNKISVADAVNAERDDLIADRLSNIFSYEELRYIEDVFEDDFYRAPSHFDPKMDPEMENETDNKFGKERLVAILNTLLKRDTLVLPEDFSG